MKTKSTKRSGPTAEGSQSADHPQSSKAPFHAFKLILVPVDFSESSVRGLDFAAALAHKLHARLIVLHVLEPAIYPENYLNPTAADAANGSGIGAARERLSKVVQRSAAQSLVSEVLVRMGRAQSDIADTANATGADLIVMGVQGAGPLKQDLLGGTAERVLRNSPCPVLTVPFSKK
jgi:nucleotide-binding universal stress UspA family protein